jgi:hypothetical protein
MLFAGCLPVAESSEDSLPHWDFVLGWLVVRWPRLWSAWDPFDCFSWILVSVVRDYYSGFFVFVDFLGFFF